MPVDRNEKSDAVGANGGETVVAPVSGDTLRRLFERTNVAILIANDNATYVEANSAAYTEDA